ncbi:bifunctional phosphatase PAP2/diacylglycerol kinase family protein [Nocardia aurantia]|uniref:Lipid kinase YegS n=1 Tax=Nocardia aurantia TaxID=2585199 RepID=A0A7K0DT28_9NOCA|nr:phosphatase PAP2 family protein [Nocardia aurantia]MQY28930.1 lipid kinase YegS [Nocardia aurantia]
MVRASTGGSGLRRTRGRIAAADLRLLDAVGARRSVVLDRVLPGLGRWANHGVLWFVVGIGISVRKDRRTRRAALRGAAAIGIASPLTNLVFKNVFRRSRPPITGVPLVRHLVRPPITPSFPSGHSASAAAFATAVAMEAPAAVAVPVGVLAASVAVSRVVSGAHYPSDVVVGAAVGTGCGLLTRLWWPVRPPGRATAAESDADVPAPVSGAGVVVLINDGAGTTNPQLSEVIRAELPDAEVLVLPGDEMEEALRRAAGSARVVAVAGGDGTVNAAARHLAGTDVPLLVLPAGTLNHFAHELGVHTVDDALSALRAGHAVRVDVGRVDGRVFLNTCAFGLYTDLVAFRGRWEGRIGKWPAMLAGMFHVLRRGQPQSVLIDGVPRLVWMIFLGNGRYHPAGFAPAYRSRLDDGLLDVRIVEAGTPFAATWMVFAMLTRTLRWCPAYRQYTSPRVHFATADPVLRLSLDGEYTEVSEQATLRIDPAALLVYRPPGDVE